MSAVQDVGTFVTPRDLALFRALVVARVLDGEQAMSVGGFHSVRRANRRLLKLVRAGLLRRWFVGSPAGGLKALYGLAPQAFVLLGESSQGLISWKQDGVITSSQFLAHQQAVNEVFIRARFQTLPYGLSCERWSTFREPLAPSIGLIPDAYCEIKQADVAHPMFLEVDLGTEASKVWRQKVERYLRLAVSGEFERIFGQRRFRTLVLFPSVRRLESVRKTILHRTDKLFWLSTFDQLRRDGLWAPIWFRPTSGAEQRLLDVADKE